MVVGFGIQKSLQFYSFKYVAYQNRVNCRKFISNLNLISFIEKFKLTANNPIYLFSRNKHARKEKKIGFPIYLTFEFNQTCQIEVINLRLNI